MHFLTKNKRNFLISKILFLLILFFQFSAFEVFSYDDAEVTNKSVIDLVNLERGRRGIEKLKENEILNKVAQSKLNDMIEDDYFAHTSPKGVDPWEWFSKEGYRFEYAGENLAMNFKNFKDQHDAWMESALHKKNILDSRFTHVGIAVSEKNIGNEFFFVTVQVFGTPEKNVIKSANFTPQTFHVSSEIIYADLDEESLMPDEENGDCIFDCDDRYSGLVWSILVFLTLLIAFVEYRFFVKSSK